MSEIENSGSEREKGEGDLMRDDEREWEKLSECAF